MTESPETRAFKERMAARQKQNASRRAYREEEQRRDGALNTLMDEALEAGRPKDYPAAAAALEQALPELRERDAGRAVNAAMILTQCYLHLESYRDALDLIQTMRQMGPNANDNADLLRLEEESLRGLGRNVEADAVHVRLQAVYMALRERLETKK